MTRSIRYRGGAACLTAVLFLAACNPPPTPPLPAPNSVPAPDPQTLESVIFLLGDPGLAYLSTSPTLARLQQEVESWSYRLAGDSSVAVFVLGDVRYPEGVRDPDSSEFEGDTAVVMSQVRTVAGPVALDRGAAIYFLAGNHDWGLEEHFEGFVRLVNLDNLLGSARRNLGVRAELIPQAGTGGPYVIDWGRHVRLIALDTAWWLLAGDAPEKTQVVDSLRSVYTAAGDREVMFMAHHPFRSVGPHGGQFSFWETIGARYLLSRSGAILQDITSRPFRQLEYGLRDIFATEGPPIAFLAGHDHSLQVLGRDARTDPAFNVVSGSGSKVSEVGRSEDMLFAQPVPGYIKIFIERDGGMLLHVEGTGSEYLECPTVDPARSECMSAGVAAFSTLYGIRMK